MAGLAAAGAAKSMGAIVRGFDTRYKMGRGYCKLTHSSCNDLSSDNNLITF